MQCRDLLALRVYMESHTGSWPVEELLSAFFMRDSREGEAYFGLKDNWMGGKRRYVAHRYALATPPEGEEVEDRPRPSWWEYFFAPPPTATSFRHVRCAADVSNGSSIGEDWEDGKSVPIGLPIENEFAFLYDRGEWRLRPDEAELTATREAYASAVPCFRPTVVDVHPSSASGREGIGERERSRLGAQGVRFVPGAGPDTDASTARAVGRGYTGEVFPSSPRSFWREQAARAPLMVNSIYL